MSPLHDGLPPSRRQRPHPLAAAPSAPPELEVIFLGTAAASGLPNHATSSMLLRYGDERVLIDCGNRTLGQLRRAGIDPASITAIVITHWHTDHVAGLPTLINALAHGQRSTPLVIYAPPPPRGVTGTLGLTNRLIAVRLQKITPGTVIPLRGGSLTSIATDHVITSLGYAFQEDGARGRRIVFSGDTRPSVGILNAARGADLLVHEATFVSGRAPWAQKIGHCTALQTAELARSAGVGALALTHISARDDRPDILAEARTIFPGAVLPDDLEVLTVPPRQLGAAAARLRAGWSNVVHRVLRVAPDVDGLAS